MSIDENLSAFVSLHDRLDAIKETRKPIAEAFKAVQDSLIEQLEPDKPYLVGDNQRYVVLARKKQKPKLNESTIKIGLLSFFEWHDDPDEDSEKRADQATDEISKKRDRDKEEIPCLRLKRVKKPKDDE